MADTFEFEVDGESYADIEQKAIDKARGYFGVGLFDLEIHAAPDRHLPDAYRAQVIATVRYPS